MAEITPIPTEFAVNERLYLSPREVAELTGLSESEVYRGIYRGALVAMKYRGRRWLIARKDVDAWLEAESEPSIA